MMLHVICRDMLISIVVLFLLITTTLSLDSHVRSRWYIAQFDACSEWSMSLLVSMKFSLNTGSWHSVDFYAKQERIIINQYRNQLGSNIWLSLSWFSTLEESSFTSVDNYTLLSPSWWVDDKKLIILHSYPSNQDEMVVDQSLK